MDDIIASPTYNKQSSLVVGIRDGDRGYDWILKQEKRINDMLL